MHHPGDCGAAGALPTHLRHGRTWLLGLVAVLAGFVVLAIAYALVVPIGHSADEFSHLNYAHLIAAHGALPGATVLERQQPPLYYLLCAALFKAGLPDLAGRLLSVVLGLLTLGCISLTARRLVPERPWIAVCAAAIVGLLPGFQFVSGSVTDDSLAFAVGAWLFLLVVLVAQSERLSPALLLGAGAATGVALLAKQTDWILLLLLLAVLVWRHGPRLRAGQVLGLVAVPVAIAGWWYVRNLAAFHRLLPALQLGGTHTHLAHLGQLRGFVSTTLRSLYGPLRYQGGLVTLPPVGDGLLAVLALSALVLVGVGAALAARRWTRWDPCRRAIAVALGVAPLLVAVPLVGNSLLLDLQPQGRYLMPAVAAPALVASWAASRLTARHRALGIGAAVGYAAASVALSIMGLVSAAALPG